MYGADVAEVYEDLYVAGQGKDYAAEAGRVTELVRRHRPAADSLLDVACGTGAHLAHLRHTFSRVAGVELSEPMRQVALRRLPDVPVYAGDMRDFDLGESFDAVTCLFSSIGYVADLAQLHAAVARMAAHLRPGGVLVIEPWFTPDAWRDGHLGHTVACRDGRTVVSMSYSSRSGRTSRMEVHYLVGEPSGGVRHFRDTHVMTLFTTGEYEQAVAAAGLAVAGWHDGFSAGRDLLVATRPA
ncbi:MAG: class I SAM-dependent methyltransferase [Micromonosporaceae bacterium]